MFICNKINQLMSLYLLQQLQIQFCRQLDWTLNPLVEFHLEVLHSGREKENKIGCFQPFLLGTETFWSLEKSRRNRKVFTHQKIENNTLLIYLFNNFVTFTSHVQPGWCSVHRKEKKKCRAGMMQESIIYHYTKDNILKSKLRICIRI